MRNLHANNAVFCTAVCSPPVHLIADDDDAVKPVRDMMLLRTGRARMDLALIMATEKPNVVVGHKVRRNYCSV